MSPLSNARESLSSNFNNTDTLGQVSSTSSYETLVAKIKTCGYIHVVLFKAFVGEKRPSRSFLPLLPTVRDDNFWQTTLSQQLSTSQSPLRLTMGRRKKYATQEERQEARREAHRAYYARCVHVPLTRQTCPS